MMPALVSHEDRVVEAELGDAGADLATCASEWVRGFLAQGISLSTSHTESEPRPTQVYFDPTVGRESPGGFEK